MFVQMKTQCRFVQMYGACFVQIVQKRRTRRASERAGERTNKEEPEGRKSRACGQTNKEDSRKKEQNKEEKTECAGARSRAKRSECARKLATYSSSASPSSSSL